jgi:pimeloyl-ACP methyl ester carboxylesterase
MKRFIRLAPMVALVTAGLVAVPQAANADGTDPSWSTCTQYTVPVNISATDTTVYQLSGRLCGPSNLGQNVPGAIEVLVPGSTYDHNYWNIGYQPATYSYVWAATRAGYATFNIDRLGTGKSSKPAAPVLTVPNQAYVLQQIILKLRNAQIGSTGYKTVVTVGHSLGGGIVQYEAGTATGKAVPDLVVITDFTHEVDPDGRAAVQGTYYPAANDPKFAGAGLPADYLTSMPGTRGASFYYAPNADPGVIKVDEAEKATGTASELQTMAASRDPSVSLAIAKPVLQAVGQYDKIDCNTAGGLPCDSAADLKNRESKYFGAKACLQTYVQPNGGHDTVLHKNAPAFFSFIHSWLDSYTRTLNRDGVGCAL